jgi:hypothetical protein
VLRSAPGCSESHRSAGAIVPSAGRPWRDRHDPGSDFPRPTRCREAELGAIHANHRSHARAHHPPSRSAFCYHTAYLWRWFLSGTTLSSDDDPGDRIALTSDAEAAKYLSEHLGQQLTAYVCGVKDLKTVGRWASGDVAPRAGALMRLRVAFFAAVVLVDAYGSETARSWFMGTNGVLGDSPAWVLRHGQNLDDLRLVVPVAKEFASAAVARRADARSRSRFQRSDDGGPGLPNGTRRAGRGS